MKQGLSKPIRKKDEKLLKFIRTLPCCVCGKFPVHASHIKTRGSGGPDEPWNVVPHCPICHHNWGQSWVKFIAKYPPMAFKLRALGWSWADGKLWHPGLGSMI